MNVLFLSQDSSVLGVAKRIENEGHVVNVLMRRPTQAGQGIVNVKVMAGYTTINVLAYIKKVSPDLVIIDQAGLSTIATHIRSLHIPVVGGNEVVEALELDEEYCATILQHFDVAEGVEGGVWCNGKECFCYYQSDTYDRMCNDDVGPVIGCMGTLISFVQPQEGVGAELKKLEPFLIKANYRGHLGLRNGKVTAGFSYDSFYALAELLNFKLLDLFTSVAQSTPLPSHPSTSVGCSIRVISPAIGSVVGGLSEPALKHTWLKDVACHEDQYSVVGQNVLSVSALGDKHSAVGRCYRSIRLLEMVDAIYRTDIGRQRGA